MGDKIPVAEPDIGEEELRNVIEAVKSNWVSSKGPFIEEFEADFSRYTDVKYGVSASNGTTALHLALAALKIEPGDEVIVPTLTFVAVSNAVIYMGAKPVLVDSTPDYWCIDPDQITSKITKKTKAIIPVHVYGHPCDLAPIMKIAKDHNLSVIEDCAEAHGAEYNGRKVGSFGDIACFSFYGNKIITTGEGGMCLTNDADLAKRMKILRDHGMNPEKRYWHECVGFNYRMTNMQAALGVAQLKKMDSFINKKRAIAKLYNSLLDGVAGVTLHPEMPWAKNVYWLYSVLINSERYGKTRDNLIKELARNDVETRPFFYPTHVMPPYIKYAKNCCFPVADNLSSTGINLPSGVKLTENDIAKVSELIHKLAP